MDGMGRRTEYSGEFFRNWSMLLGLLFFLSSFFFSLWSNCVLFCKYFGNGMFSAMLPEACFLFPRVWDVVFIHELLRMSSFYDLERDFHMCTPGPGPRGPKGQHIDALNRRGSVRSKGGTFGHCYWHAGLPWWLSGQEPACRRHGFSSRHGSRRSPGEGNGNPLQYSCLGNSMERGAWQAIVHGVSKESDRT